MATIDQMVAAMRLITEADHLYHALYREAVNTDDEARRERINVIRRKAIARIGRRNEAYYQLVYGEAR